MNAPAIRFPEFREPWRITKLGQEATFSKGRGVSKADITEGGKTPCIRYGQLYTDYGTVIDQVVSTTNVHPSMLRLSQGGEVIVPASGEDAKDIATAAVVLSPGVALGGDLNIITSEHDGRFMASYLSGKKRSTLASLAQGNSVVHLYSHQLSGVEIAIPSLFEQRRIADTLSSVDAKIDLLQHKKTALEQFKIGLMQKLFSRELRFTRDDGSAYPAWEEKELSELAIRSSQKNRDRFITRVLTNSAVHGVVDQLDYFDKDIANEVNNDGYYVVKVGDFVYNPRISSQAPVGPLKRNDVADGIISPLYTVIRFHSADTGFYAHYFATDLWHDYMKSVGNQGARHDRMAVNIRDMMRMPLPIPCAEEASRIAEVGKDLGMRIMIIDKKIATMRIFKKGLLQQMFI